MNSSVFDPKVFLEQSFKGGLDTTYVLPDEGDYMLQCNAVNLRSGTISAAKDRAGEPWATADFQWELLGESADEQKTALKMDKLFARQSIMLDLVVENGRVTGLDFGVNRNMRLKRLLEATGLNSNKNWNFASFKNATAWGTVIHNQPEGFDDPIAEVKRVTSLAKGQARAAA